MQLELTNRQLNLLRELLSYVGGNPSGPRAEFDAILSYIKKVEGFKQKNNKVIFYNPDILPHCNSHCSPAIYVDTKEDHDGYYKSK